MSFGSEWSRLRHAVETLLRKERVERDLDEELAFHIEMQTRLNREHGLPEEPARTAALRAFGGVEKWKEQCRSVRGGRLLESFFQDLSYGLRCIRTRPAFAAAVVLTLAFGIGANTAIFSVVRGVLLRPLPYAAGDRLVVLHEPARLSGIDDVGFSPPEIADLRARSHALDRVVEYHSMFFNLLGRGEPERVRTGVVSANFFDALGARPLLGRTFLPQDDRAGAEPVLVLSYEYWQDSRGGDPAIVGKTFRMNGKIHTVVGVLPHVPQYPQANDIYLPVAACPFRSAPMMAHDWSGRMLLAFGRLAPGASLASARSELGSIAAAQHRDHPESYPANQGLATVATPLREELTRKARPTLLTLLAAVVLVLLIACANVANLTLARLFGRERELAVRTALGAGRGRLVRQLLTESTLLAVAGGALGLVLAAVSHGLLVSLAARFTPRAFEIRIDGGVLLFTLLASIVTGLAAGALPLLRRREMSSGLQAGLWAGGTAPSGQRLRGAMIVLQLALSFTLLIGAGLMLRSLLQLERVAPGYASSAVLTSHLSLDFSRYMDAPRRLAFADAVLERVGAQPGIRAAALASSFPLSDVAFSQTLRVEHRAAEPGEAAPKVDLRVVTAGYFQTLGIPLLAGRLFTPGDDPKAAEVVLVNQTLARRLWAGRDPLGARLSFADNGNHWRTVVGVVGDVREHGLEQEADAEAYVPLPQLPLLAMTLLVRGELSAAGLEREVRQAVHQVDPDQPVAEVRLLERVRSDSLSSHRVTATLLTLFAFLALLISAAGIGGLIAFSVAQRTQEIGVRVALGASRPGILWLMLRQAMVLTCAGLALGVALAHPLNRTVSGLLYGVRPTDPLTFVAVGLVFVVTTAVACLLPAQRATEIEPVIALRSE
jgi:putative ABC transport system permease protein